MNFSIDKKIIEQIIVIILSHKNVEKIVVFGSRVGGDFKETSDIDIAIYSRNWSSTDINIVKNSLEEDIKIPQKFDLVNFYSLFKKSLREEIMTKGMTIYESKKN